MPKLISNDPPSEQVTPHHAVWRPSPPKALFGSLIVSISLFYVFSYLASVAVQYSSSMQNSANVYAFPIANFAIFALWFGVSSWVLKKLGWKSSWLALFAMIIVIITASYSITSLGQTLITYPVGALIGTCVLLFYYFLYRPRIIVWLALPLLLLFIVGYQINQRTIANQTTQDQAAQNLADVFQFPIYFTDAIPTKQFLVQHFFWDTSKQNIRFVTEGNIAVNENYEYDPQQYPPITCGTSTCVDLGELRKGQHIYTDKNNPYFTEYYVMFDRTLIRLTSDKNNPLTKEQAITYLLQFKKTSPTQLLSMFDHSYFLSDSYYFIPKQRYNQTNADYSVIGETNF